MRTTLCLVSIFLALCFPISTAYRLNVPRVLLPYHPTIQVQFLLEVSHPEGGCFNWRSSRPSVVAIEAVNPQTSGCSDKALITSKSKFAKEESVVVYVENQGEGVSFSCDVTVDVIHSIAITTTTKVLYMDAAPARMVVEAINAEGDRFSTLGQIPFDWGFSFKDAGDSLKIVPFAQSDYNAPPGIEELEQKGKKGHLVLVEGLLSGSGQLTATFSEPHFAHIQASGIELFAVANVMLVPSHDIYLPVNAQIHYKAIVQRKNHNEEIILPSPHYSIQIADQNICGFDPANSVVTAKTAGSTEVTLIDSTGVEKLKNIVKPRSARLYVVEPKEIRYRIEPGNVWHLQKGLEYNIHLQLLDADANVIHIPENAIFTTRMPETYVKVLEKSRNNSYFRVKAIKTGKGVIKSAFEALVGQDGKVYKAKPVVLGERQVVVSDQVAVAPKTLVFPYQSKHSYEYELKAIGGTGQYHWTSSDVSVARVDQSSGLVRSIGVGEVVVNVQDVFNHNHYDQAKIYVAEAYELHFGPSSQESVVGSKLVLNLKVLAKTKIGILPFTDCRHLPFKFTVGDESVFAVDEAAVSTITESSCATVTLKALSPGQTQLTARMDRLAARVEVTSFVALTAIRIVPSSMQVDNGNLISAHIQGVTEDGSVFNFDDGLYPFDVVWKVSPQDAVQIRSPVASFIDESPQSRFSINLHTLKSGQVTLAAVVRADSASSRNLFGKVHQFSHQVQLVVDEVLRLVAPELAVDTLRMSPKTSLNLAANKKKTRFVVPLHSTALVHIQPDKSDILQSFSKEGNAVLEMQAADSQRSALVHVEVLPVKSLHIRVDLPDSFMAVTEGVKFLPKNTKIKLNVEFRDAAGRLFHAANNHIHYKFHRNDLVKVVPSSNNRTFEVHLKELGQTIFKAWDATNPKLAAFLRLAVGESVPVTAAAVPVIQQEKAAVLPAAAPIKQMVKPLVKPEQQAGSTIAYPTGEKASSGLHAAISSLIERYNTMAVSLFVLVLSLILLVAGFWYNDHEGNGDGNQNNYTQQTSMAHTPSHIAEISPIHDPTTSASDNRNTWLSTNRPLYQSTPGSNSPAVSGSRSGQNWRNAQLSPRNAALEEQSSLGNYSKGSAGSAEDPYLWTINDSYKGNTSLVNRHYR